MGSWAGDGIWVFPISVTFCSLTLSDKGIDLSNSCGHGRVELIEKTKKTLPYNLAKVGLELKRN